MFSGRFGFQTRIYANKASIEFCTRHSRLSYRESERLTVFYANPSANPIRLNPNPVPSPRHRSSWLQPPPSASAKNLRLRLVIRTTWKFKRKIENRWRFFCICMNDDDERMYLYPEGMTRISGFVFFSKWPVKRFAEKKVSTDLFSIAGVSSSIFFAWQKNDRESFRKKRALGQCLHEKTCCKQRSMSIPKCTFFISFPNGLESNHFRREHLHHEKRLFRYQFRRRRDIEWKMKKNNWFRRFLNIFAYFFRIFQRIPKNFEKVLPQRKWTVRKPFPVWFWSLLVLLSWVGGVGGSYYGR